MRVVIVGGGIVGSSAAYHLAIAGSEVVLVDSADECRATAAGAGIVMPGPVPGTSPATWRLGALAAEHYPKLVAALGEAGITETGYARVGLISLAEEADLDAAYEQASGLQAMLGAEATGPIATVPPGEPAARCPVVPVSYAGVTIDGFARVDGRRLVAALREVATQHGARFVNGTASLSAAGGGVDVLVGGDQVEADAVVVAAGAWSAGLCEPFGVRLPVYPHKGVIARYAMPEYDTARWPIVQSPDWRFLVGAPGGLVVGGGTREPDAGFDTRVTAGSLRQALTDTLAVGPGLTDAAVAEVRVGFRPASRDGEPVLGRLAAYPEVVVATGLDTLGLTFGAYEGAVAADLALGREVAFDLDGCRPDRDVPAA